MGARVVAIVLASIAYVIGTYWLMTRPGNSPWNAVGCARADADRDRGRARGAAVSAGSARLPRSCSHGLCAQAPHGRGRAAQLAVTSGSTPASTCSSRPVSAARLRAGHTPLVTTMGGARAPWS